MYARKYLYEGTFVLEVLQYYLRTLYESTKVLSYVYINIVVQVYVYEDTFACEGMTKQAKVVNSVQHDKPVH